MKVTISDNILDTSIADLKIEFGVTETDQTLVRKFGSIVSDKLDVIIDEFYETLKKTDYFDQFFPNEEEVQRVGRFLLMYWKDFFESDLDEAYFEERTRIGQTHARINLPLKTYLVGFNMFGNIFAGLISNGDDGSNNALQIMTALNRRIHLDASIVASTYAVMMNEIVVSRSESLEEEMAQRLEAETDLKKQLAEIERMNKELSYFNKMATGRELKMIELKKEINELAKNLGEDDRYEIA